MEIGVFERHGKAAGLAITAGPLGSWRGTKKKLAYPEREALFADSRRPVHQHALGERIGGTGASQRTRQAISSD